MLDPCASLVRIADRDRYLSTLYAPAALRPALFALHALDLELAKVVATTTETMIGEIRLAWWREALLRLDSAPPPAQPVLQAVAAHVLPRGIRGRSLEALEDGYLALLLGQPMAAPALEQYLARRGGAFFAALGNALTAADAGARAQLDEWGRAWALAQLAVLGPVDRIATGGLVDAVDRLGAAPPAAIKPALRPLAGLAALARRDLWHWRAGHPPEPRGTLARQAILLRLAIIGR